MPGVARVDRMNWSVSAKALKNRCAKMNNLLGLELLGSCCNSKSKGVFSSIRDEVCSLCPSSPRVSALLIAVEL